MFLPKSYDSPRHLLRCRFSTDPSVPKPMDDPREKRGRCSLKLVNKGKCERFLMHGIGLGLVRLDGLCSVKISRLPLCLCDAARHRGGKGGMSKSDIKPEVNTM